MKHLRVDKTTPETELLLLQIKISCCTSDHLLLPRLNNVKSNWKAVQSGCQHGPLISSSCKHCCDAVASSFAVFFFFFVIAIVFCWMLWMICLRTMHYWHLLESHFALMQQSGWNRITLVKLCEMSLFYPWCQISGFLLMDFVSAVNPTYLAQSWKQFKFLCRLKWPLAKSLLKPEWVRVSHCEGH